MSNESESNEVDTEARREPASTLIVAGSAIAGIATAVLAITGNAPTAIVVLPAVIVAIALTTVGQGLFPATRTVVFVAAIVTSVLTALDLVGVLANLGTLDRRGGIVGLALRVVVAVGAALLVVGGWRSADLPRGLKPGALERPEQIALLGGLGVIAGWLLMLTSTWNMSPHQAIGLAAATALVTVLWLDSRWVLPISAKGRPFLITDLAVLTVTMAVVSLITVVPDLAGTVDLAGPWAAITYFVYIAASALVAASAVLLLIAAKDSPEGLSFTHAVVTGFVGVVALVIGLAAIDSDPQQPPSEPSATATTSASNDDNTFTPTTLALGTRRFADRSMCAPYDRRNRVRLGPLPR